MNSINRMSSSLLDFDEREDGRSTVEAEHKCEKLNTLYQSDYENFVIVKNRDIWYLFRETYADEQAVLSGEADELGESIDQSGIYIEYCPFCGMNLGGRDLA